MSAELLALLQQREQQQEHLLDHLEIMVVTHDQDSGHADDPDFYRKFSMGVALAALSYLIRHDRGLEMKDFTQSGFFEGQEFFTNTLLPRIKEFTPIVEEQLVIIDRIFSKAITCATRRFHENFHKLTLYHREKFLKDIGMLQPELVL